MGQVFRPSINTIAKVSIPAVLLILGGLLTVLVIVPRSPWVRGQKVPVEQPIQFSHKHHVGDVGVDCRYCHTSVETSSYAGIPSTNICMNCHSQIWSDSPTLQVVRDSYENDVPLNWNLVHKVPDYAFFNHSIHVAKGMGCTTCHGPVGDMPVVWKGGTLLMEWCLQCHRNPEKYVRPQEAVFDPTWQPPANQAEIGRQLVVQYNIEAKLDCYVCHR